MYFGAVVGVIDGVYLGRLLSSEPERMEADLQFECGEGPGIEAAVSGTFIEVRDFQEATWRWPVLAPAALAAGCRSAWCIPLPHPGKPGLVLTYSGFDPIPDDASRFLRIARVVRIARSLLVDHPGTITTWSIQCHIDQTVRERAVTYQASGVLAARLSIDPAPALDLMRMRAWAEERSLRDVSARLIRSA